MTEILPGFPEMVEGEIIFCDNDSINTDGIYHGKYTYQDGMTKEKMVAVCMENYDPEFQATAKKGDINKVQNISLFCCQSVTYLRPFPPLRSFHVSRSLVLI